MFKWILLYAILPNHACIFTNVSNCVWFGPILSLATCRPKVQVSPCPSSQVLGSVLVGRGHFLRTFLPHNCTSTTFANATIMTICSERVNKNRFEWEHWLWLSLPALPPNLSSVWSNCYILTQHHNKNVLYFFDIVSCCVIHLLLLFLPACNSIPGGRVAARQLAESFCDVVTLNSSTLLHLQGELRICFIVFSNKITLPFFTATQPLCSGFERDDRKVQN